MTDFSKARDIARLNTPSFENKLFYCRFVSKYHDDYEMAAGYEDGAEVCLSNKSKEELDYYRDLVKALVNGEMDIETLKELEGDEE